ncbi:MAG: DoxX family protein [Cytophagales bacterium]|nr:DoxX family protein [Cytophagales bacterium]
MPFSKTRLFTVLRIITGSLFIFSGIIKLFPIEIFEIQFVFGNGIPWILAPIISRLLITLELTLGFFLVFNFWTKKITLPFTIGLLVVFNCLLIYQLTSQGNQENCGCLGTFISLNSYESIFKNILLIIILFLIKNNKSYSFDRKIWLVPSLYITNTIIIFLYYPVPNINNYSYSVSVNREASFLKNIGANHLLEGEHLILFMSLKCSHCKKLGRRISHINKVKKLPHIHAFFLESTHSNPSDFIKETGFSFDYSMLKRNQFFPIVGRSVPVILHLKNGKILNRWTNRNFNPDDL